MSINDRQNNQNHRMNNFAKAGKNLVYVPEPLCALSLFREFSVNCLTVEKK